jgi:hypothetical protein
MAVPCDIGEPDRPADERERRGANQRVRHPARRPGCLLLRIPEREHVPPRVVPTENRAAVEEVPGDSHLRSSAA